MTWVETANKIQIGDKVCFKTSHLFSTGMLRTSLAHLSGTVTGFEEGNALIKWDSSHDQPSVPLKHLTRLTARGVIE